MRNQIAKRTALWKLALPAAMLLALAGTADAQNSNGIQASGPNGMLQAKDAADKQAAKEYINKMDADDQYQKAIRDQPSAKSSNDPWGSVRPTAAPTTPAVKSAAKPATATKSASSAAKPAKPAAGSAGTTPTQ
jgi:hypothetical protein